jgi:hypothetical protein
MATLPTTYGRTEQPTAKPVRVEDLYRLRPLPQEDVFFYCKKIDNGRLVREADPKAQGACWSAVGAVCAVVALLTAALAPSVASTMAGYKLEGLKAEERRLTEERRVLQLREAELLSPQHLEELAQRQNLVTPKSGQVVRLDGNKPTSAVAMVK